MARYVLIIALISRVSVSLGYRTTTNKPFKKDYRGHFFTSDDEVKKFLFEFDEDYDESSKKKQNSDDRYFIPKPIEFGTKEHNLHVDSLKSVNGYKTRNLYIKTTRLQDPYIYITNPIEAGFPHPFIPTRDIKDILWERIQLQKDVLAERNRDKLKYIPRLVEIKQKRVPFRESGRREEDTTTSVFTTEKTRRTIVTTTFKPSVQTLSPEEQVRKFQQAVELNREDTEISIY